MQIIKRFAMLAIIAGVVGMSTANAEAGWLFSRLSGGSSGSSGSWGSSGSSGSSGGYHVHRHRRHHHGSWGSSGSSGSWGSWGWSGSSGSWGSSGGYSVPMIESDKPAEEGADADASASIEGGSAVLTVSVPAEATIYVNDKATTTPGAERQFVSRNLAPGAVYTYRIRAEVERDGQKLTETKTITMTAGDQSQLRFDFQAAVAQKKETTEEQLPTKLTVRLPADAKLYLAGAETKSTGEVRTFSTTLLEGDSTWTDYTLRAERIVDGQTIVAEKTITLRSGEAMDVTLDFDDEKLASIAR